MRPLPPLLGAVRQALEAAYGLALEGLGEDQIEAAVYGAGADGMADVRDPQYLARVVDRLPIDESWLFRDDGLWEWVRDAAGPALLEQASLAGRPVRVLSLGCSGGQEAFTAALLLEDLLEWTGIPASAAGSYLQVLGVDSSPLRVEAARAGVVPGWSVQRCREGWLRGRFPAEPGPVARHRVPQAVRAVCRFEVANLLELAARGNAALGGYDLVFCRNVLIYFRADAAARLAADLASGLDPGAHLIFSAAEAHLVTAAGLQALPQLGVGRAEPRAVTAPVRPALRRSARHGRARPGAQAAAPRPPVRAAPTAAARRPALPLHEGAPEREQAVAAHLGRALRLVAEGHSADALREVRAALVHDPRHLYSRLLLGQQLIGVDARRGRQVLRELVESAGGLPPDGAVSCADGLSVGQLAAAARILLTRREDA